MTLTPRPRAALRALGVAIAVATSTAACGLGVSSGSGGARGSGLTVMTSFYPLQYVAERVGGPTVTVSSLTRPGTEPHDLELTPRDVARLQDADLVVYLRGFQPAVDQAVDEHAKATRVVNTATAANLDLTITGPADGHDGGHADEQTGAVDPHFWLDPTRLAKVTDQVADAMAKADPAQAATFHANAASLVSDLDALDREFRTGLAQCANTDLVTSHSAFGYLAKRYGLQQVGITGLSPETEPDPHALAEVAQYVRRNHVRTIYYESLVSPAIARTVAQETGTTTAVLDPVEGLSKASAGRDYLQIMRSNLASLRAGQDCR